MRVMKISQKLEKKVKSQDPTSLFPGSDTRCQISRTGTLLGFSPVRRGYTIEVNGEAKGRALAERTFDLYCAAH